MHNFEQVRGHLNSSGYKVTMHDPYVACVELSLGNGKRHQAIFLSELGNDDERGYLRVSTVIATRPAMASRASQVLMAAPAPARAGSCRSRCPRRWPRQWPPAC